MTAAMELFTPTARQAEGPMISVSVPLGFLEKVFRFLRFSGFSVQRCPDKNYDPGRTSYKPFSLLVSLNNNKTH